MTGPLTASALRQEGPQQELRLRALASLGALEAHARAMHNSHVWSNITPAPGHVIESAADDWGFATCPHPDCLLVRSVDMAALSASRTAQAPQQELARTTLICAAHMLDACAENMQKLCVGYGAEQMRGIAQRLRDGTPTLEQACTADDLKKAQARIQVLETSVDYLRYLVDHPVKQWLPIEMMPEVGQVIVCWSDNQFDTIGRDEYLECVDLGEVPAKGWMPLPAPPVAPAEGEQ